jgi:hypothetical protein
MCADIRIKRNLQSASCVSINPARAGMAVLPQGRVSQTQCELMLVESNHPIHPVRPTGPTGRRLVRGCGFDRRDMRGPARRRAMNRGVMRRTFGHRGVVIASKRVKGACLEPEQRKRETGREPPLRGWPKRESVPRYRH